MRRFLDGLALGGVSVCVAGTTVLISMPGGCAQARLGDLGWGAEVSTRCAICAVLSVIAVLYGAVAFAGAVLCLA